MIKIPMSVLPKPRHDTLAPSRELEIDTTNKAVKFPVIVLLLNMPIAVSPPIRLVAVLVVLETSTK